MQYVLKYTGIITNKNAIVQTAGIAICVLPAGVLKWSLSRQAIKEGFLSKPSLTHHTLTRELKIYKNIFSQSFVNMDHDQLFITKALNSESLDYLDMKNCTRNSQDTLHAYQYTDDLTALEAHQPVIPRLLPTVITTPLIIDNWHQALCDHPDKQFVHYILQGFHTGKPLMLPMSRQPQPVDDYTAKEVAAGRIVGPFRPHELPGDQISCFGVIPKASQLGLILDLSSPKRFQCKWWHSQWSMFIDICICRPSSGKDI